MNNAKEISINTEFIKMTQLLKLSNIASQGSEAKFYIQEGYVSLNDAIVHEFRKKVYPGSFVTVKLNGETINLKVV